MTGPAASSARRAARAVAMTTHLPAAERKELLDMLGLLDGDTLVEPRPTSLDVAPLEGNGGERLTLDVDFRADYLTRPTTSTAPEGLRCYQPRGAA